MMVERRSAILVAALGALLGMALVWHASVRPAGTRPSPPSGSALTGQAPPAAATPTAPPSAPPPPPPPAASGPAPDAQPAPPPSSADGGPSYIVLLARAETRRRIRASAGLTYLNDIVAAANDSMLHRWDNRIQRPVRVSLAASAVANFQPAFLDAVRSAFQRWQEAGVPVRFDTDADSADAEVHVQWRIQFEGPRAGQTDLAWDQDGRLLGGTVTLATFDAKGRPFGPEEVRVMALHEVGHVIGLDHSPDSSDIMFPMPRVRDLSARDIATARLLYDLAPGSLR